MQSDFAAVNITKAFILDGPVASRTDIKRIFTIL